MEKDSNHFSDNKNANAYLGPKFDFDEFEFNPITEGLGFHHEKEKKTVLPKSTKPQNLVSGAAQFPRMQQDIQSIVNPELAPFYSATKPNAHVEKEKSLPKNLEAATSTHQFFAWLLDMAFLSCFVSITFVLFMLFSGIEQEYFFKMVRLNEVSFFFLTFLSLYYLFYFSFFDLTSTFGKSLVGIKVVTIDNKQPELKNTFIRSFISLVSFIAIGLPNILDFQGRLSDTKVVKA